MKRLVLGAVLPLLLLLSACAQSQGGGAGGGGTGDGSGLGTIHGTVLAGPTCPVERAESPCPDRPVGGVTVQATQGDLVTATATSGDDGAFTMDLAAGDYLLQAVVEPEGPGMYSQPTRVSVPAGASVDATVLLDTGIRQPVGS